MTNTVSLQERFQKLLPYLAPPLVFLVMLGIYFSPAFGGKVLYQHDIFQWEGMAKEVIDYRNTTGQEALWTNNMFGGMPAFQISTLYPGNLFYKIDLMLGLGLPHPANLIFKLFLGFYLLLLALRLNPWLSGAGGFAFAFSTYFFTAIDAGHNTKIDAIAYMAPVIMGIVLAYQGRYLLGGTIAAISVALELTANHVQITYYLFMIIGIMALSMLVDAVLEKKIKQFLTASVVLAIAAAIGVGPTIGSLWTTKEYSDETIRGKSELAQFAPKDDITKAESGLDKEYAFRWSSGKWETTTLMLPNSVGGSSQGKLGEGSETYKLLKSRGVPNPKKVIESWPTYWGDQPFTSGPVYVGAFVCFLFILGLIAGDHRYRWWLLAATLVSIFLSWGRHLPGLNYWLFDHLPMYNKFRAPAMILVIAEFTMPLLGFWTLSKFLESGQNEDRDKKARLLLIAGGVFAGLLALLFLVGGSSQTFTREDDASGFARMFGVELNNPLIGEFVDAAIADRKALFRMDILKAFFFVGIGVAALYFYIKNRIPAMVMNAAIAFIVVVDLWMVDADYLNKDNFVKKNEYSSRQKPEPWNQEIMQDKDPDYRVLNLAANTFNDAQTSYFHKSVGGYHPAKLRRYQDIIDHHLNGKISMPVINMLNTRYVINPQKQVVRNPEALGNAWFVGRIDWMENALQEIDSLGGFNPRESVLIDKRYKDALKDFQPAADSTASIRLSEYKPNYLSYECNVASPQFAVFSEIYYNSGKGWQAYLDGKPAEHFRVNYVLRGMQVPAGTKKIEFKFEPHAYLAGNQISLIGSLVLLLLLAFTIAVEAGFILKKKSNEAGA